MDNTKPSASSSAERRLPAYTALLASDNAATALVQQVTVTLTIACAAYLSATLAFLSTRESPDELVIVFLPIPVFLMQLYQLVLAGGNRRRVLSTRYFEEKLVQVAECQDAYSRYEIGSRATEASTDPDVAKTVAGNLRIGRQIAAAAPYAGFYALGVAYTFYLYVEVLRPNAPNLWVVATVIASVLWLSLTWLACATLLARLHQQQPAGQAGGA